MRVGIVGTGEMGRPLIARLRDASFDVAAFVRRPDVRSELEHEGVSCVDDMIALARGRDVVIVYVYSDDQVRDVILKGDLAKAMEPGSAIVIHTTVSPQTIEAIAARAVLSEVAVVDAPGSGGPSQVADGMLTLFVGGDTEVVNRCQPLFGAYANQVVHFGPSGTGQKVKLLNNLLFGAHVELAMEATELCDSLGIPPDLVAKTLHSCSGASHALDLVAVLGSAEALLDAAGRFIHKDVITARAATDGAGFHLGALGHASDAVLIRTRPSGRNRDDR